MVDFEVGTTSVVGDVIILEATVRFHPTTIFFNGVPFVRKDLLAETPVGEVDVLDVADIDSLNRSRPSAKSKDSLMKPRNLSINSPPSRQTSGEMSVGEAEVFHDEVDSPLSEKRTTGSSSSSIPPPPPDDIHHQGDIALFCAVCGNRNDKLENTCPSCGSTLRISVLDPELGEKIARNLSGSGVIEENASPSGAPKKTRTKTRQRVAPTISPPPPSFIPNGRAHLRASSPNREPPEVPTKRTNTPQFDKDPSPSKIPSLRPARADLADQLQQAKLKAVEDAASAVRRAAEEKQRAAEEAASAAASSDGDNDEKQSLRTRRGNATKQSALPRSSSAMALTTFKILESRKAAELVAGSFPKTKAEEEKQEPTIFKVATEFSEKDAGCFTVSIKNTSREDHVYYHLVVVTCYTTWVLKKRETDMMDLWNVLHENKVPDLPPRPRRTTGLGRRSGEELIKRMALLQEMLEGILKNKRALAIRATALFLELYRALLPS